MVSGRLRLGKTTLLVEWSRLTQRPSIYWIANRVSSAQLYRSFSQAVITHIHPEVSVNPGFSYPTWEMALGQLMEPAGQQRLIVILDEFSYATEVGLSLPSVLQNIWDYNLKQTQILLILCGSHIAMMKKLQALASSCGPSSVPMPSRICAES